jgi:hypothetical protein
LTAIYHITHVTNLPNILRDGGLWCDRVSAERNLAGVSIAHQHIKERRARKPVPCAAGGMLADYVPFYFAPRSPMLYAIHRSNVQGYQGGQTPIIYLVASAERVAQSGLSFAFTDGHAEMDLSRFFTDLDDLAQIDWNMMQARYWNDTREDGDRKRRRQAEFLVHEFFPFSLVERVSTQNREMALNVSALLSPLAQKPGVQVEPSWYY